MPLVRLIRGNILVVVARLLETSHQRDPDMITSRNEHQHAEQVELPRVGTNSIALRIRSRPDAICLVVHALTKEVRASDEEEKNSGDCAIRNLGPLE